MQRSKFSSVKPLTVNLLRGIKGIRGELAVGILYESVGAGILSVEGTFRCSNRQPKPQAIHKKRLAII